MTALLAALAMFFVYLYSQSPVLGVLVGLVVIVVVETIIISIAVFMYTTRYILTQSELMLRASIARAYSLHEEYTECSSSLL